MWSNQYHKPTIWAVVCLYHLFVVILSYSGDPSFITLPLFCLPHLPFDCWTKATGLPVWSTHGTSLVQPNSAIFRGEFMWVFESGVSLLGMIWVYPYFRGNFHLRTDFRALFVPPQVTPKSVWSRLRWPIDLLPIFLPVGQFANVLWPIFLGKRWNLLIAKINVMVA